MRVRDSEGRDGSTTGVDLSDRYEALSAVGDPLERLSAVVEFEIFRGPLVAAMRRSANAKRSKVCAAVEHVFAGQKRHMGLVVRIICIARTRIKIGMANLAYNFQRLARLEVRTAPA